MEDPAVAIVQQWWSRSTTTQVLVRKQESIKLTLFLKKTWRSSLVMQRSFIVKGSDPVGPIRSGRFQDINLVGSLNKPLFVWSGGNSKVSAAIGKSDLVDLSYSKANTDGGFSAAMNTERRTTFLQKRQSCGHLRQWVICSTNSVRLPNSE
jgi:hypothetical protein